jgi:hypothetical protein
MNTASASRTVSAIAEANDSRPLPTLERTISLSPGSKIGMSPAFNAEILAPSLSMHVT